MEEKVYRNIYHKKTCQGPVHVVEAGDTLYSIAAAHHTRVRVLLDLNPFVDVYHLKVGDEICLPQPAGPQMEQFVPYVVKPGETVGDLLEAHPCSFEELAKINQPLRKLVIPQGTILLIPREETCGQETKEG